MTQMTAVPIDRPGAKRLRIVAMITAATAAVALVLTGCAAEDSPSVTPGPTASPVSPGTSPDPDPQQPDVERPTPTITVSQTSGLDGNGDVVTVTGTGFVHYDPDTTATRRPLSGKFGGVYVTFGRNLDIWAPTDGAESSARRALETYWLVFAEDVDAIGGAAAGGYPINPDGTFEIEINVSAVHRNDPGDGNYGIYTYAGGGAEYAPFETYTALEFDGP